MNYRDGIYRKKHCVMQCFSYVIFTDYYQLLFRFFISYQLLFQFDPPEFQLFEPQSQLEEFQLSFQELL